MNTVTGMPDAAWYFARLETASPKPPVRAYGESSGTRCTTGAGVPSGRVSGADGPPVAPACSSPRLVRAVRRTAGGPSIMASAPAASEPGDTVAPVDINGSGEAPPP